MKLSDLQKRVLMINGFIEREQGDGNAMAIMLHAEVMNDLTLVLEALLEETAPEKLLEIRRGAGDSDVDLLDDSNGQRLQVEACGAGPLSESELVAIAEQVGVETLQLTAEEVARLPKS